MILRNGRKHIDLFLETNLIEALLELTFKLNKTNNKFNDQSLRLVEIAVKILIFLITSNKVIQDMCLKVGKIIIQLLDLLKWSLLKNKGGGNATVGEKTTTDDEIQKLLIQSITKIAQKLTLSDQLKNKTQLA